FVVDFYGSVPYGPASDGLVYAADNNPSVYSGSGLAGYSNVCTVSGTSDSALYDSGIYGTDFTLTLPLAPGLYQVLWKFSEPAVAPGQRIFDIYVNGAQ